MRAVVVRSFGEVPAVEDVPDPSPTADGVVIEVAACGVCRSDWHGWLGHDPTIELPHVPGHELAGTVAATGDRVGRVQVGDRVTVPFSCGCGVCEPCRAGHLQVCENDFQPGFTAWGGFAQLVAIPAADLNLVPLPPELGFEEAAALGCRFTTSFRALVDIGPVRAGEWVAVHGCGGVGLSAVAIAAALGARVVAIDVAADKLELAREVGADAVIDASATDDVPAAVHDVTGGAHVSLDAVGTASTCRASILSLRRRGRHVQVGLLLADDRDTMVPMSRVIAHELRVLGVHGMASHRYDDVLRLVTSRAVDVDRLLGRRLPLDEAPAELAAMSDYTQLGISLVTSF